MNSIRRTIIFFIISLFIHHLNGTFSPDLTDFNAYGLKIAMNEILLVQAQNALSPPTFLIQFAPYNNTQTSLQCSVHYSDMIYHYVYTVAVGRKQKQNQAHFFFAGELINGTSAAFVGTVKYNNTSVLSNIYANGSISCNSSFSYALQYLYNYDHQEYFVLGVEPNGRLAYGFSNKFVFIFDSQNTSVLESWHGNLTWPDASFMPHAIDMSENFGIITGFIQNAKNARVKYSPIIYLLNFNSSNHHPFVADQYIPIATPATWQDLLINSDANIYSAKYDMSVSINERGDVLVGMQFINRVFLFSVNFTNPIHLNNVSRNTNGRSLGNGKGVAWLDNGMAAVLVNIHSLEYQWSSSQIYIYDMQSDGYNSTSTPLSVFPNHHQTLPQNFDPTFLNIISSPSSLTLLDNIGNLLVFIPTPSGFYPSIQDSRAIALFTSQQPCVPGTYKSQAGIHDCILCPTGTKNPGNASTQCLPCSSKSFCSLGSANEVPQSALETTVQLIAYLKSPESTIFDEILIQNMIKIRRGPCLVKSPLFWTLIVAVCAILIIITMGILKIFMKHPTIHRIRKRIQCILTHTDLIGEGELWVGGLASFSLIILVSFAYAFSNGFIKQYPTEHSSDSNFACDISIRNAKFDTSVQSLGVPYTHTEREMFDLLNEQELLLNIDFVNTLISYDSASIQALFGTRWSTIRWLNCTNVDSILSLSIPLPYQHISIQVFLADAKTIGALRIGLYGHQKENGRYILKEFNFYQSFSKNGYVLAQNLPVVLELTKVINETLPMEDDESNFSGIYTPTFTIDLNNLFLSLDQYVRTTLPSTTLSIILDETPYYVKNVQQPIAKLAEIVFHNLLFTVVCLEIFRLIFLSYKLIFKPLYRLLLPKTSTPDEKQTEPAKRMNDDVVHMINISNDNDVDEHNITTSF